MSHPQIRSEAGFTLVELIVVITLLSVVLGALMGVMLSIQRTYVSLRETARAQESIRTAHFVLGTIFRTAGADPQNTGLTLLDPDPQSHGTFDNVRVVSDFNPADGDVADPLEDVSVWIDADTLFVRWQAGGADQPLAFPFIELRFEYYQTDGTPVTIASQVAGATRIKFTLEAPRGPRSSAVERIESWVYLRNRR